MKHHIVAACFIVSPHLVFAQRTIDVSKADVTVGASNYFTVGGQPFVNTKFVELIEGTPYFNAAYLKAVGVDENGYEYKNLIVKLDLFDKQILYMEKGKEYIATTRLKEIIITDSAGLNYKFVHFDFLNKSGKVIGENFYQWLTSGKTSLYKEHKKTLTEHKAFASSLTQQKIYTKEKYLIFYNNAFMEAKKLKDVPSVLANKKTELEDFLKNNDDKNAAMDDRFKAIIDYYNSLFEDKK